MKRFFKTAWTISCITLTCIYIISSLSSFIPPVSFSYISLFSIAFLYILVVYIFFCTVSFFVNRWLGFIMLIILSVGYFNVINSFAFGVSKWQTQKDSAALRIMTWNVQNFVNYIIYKDKSARTSSRKEMLNTIHAYSPDILCLQEYINFENAKKSGNIRSQLDSLGYKYFFCSRDYLVRLGRNSHAYVEGGVAIYSKIPLIDSARININDEPNENLISADILFNNKCLRIFTAHLQSFELYDDTAHGKYGDNIYEITYKRRRATEYKIRETEVKHQEQAVIIRKAIDKSLYPVVYCGDLNTTPTSYNYRYLKGKNLQDAFLVQGSGIGNTFYKLGPTLRIDVCLADTSFQILQCIREKKNLSDHYSVITDLKWKSE